MKRLLKGIGVGLLWVLGGILFIGVVTLVDGAKAHTPRCSDGNVSFGLQRVCDEQLNVVCYYVRAEQSPFGTGRANTWTGPAVSCVKMDENK